MDVLFPEVGVQASLCVSVTEDCFERLNVRSQERWLKSFSTQKQRMYAGFDSMTFFRKVPEYIQQGFVQVSWAKRIDFELIELMVCIEEGYRGDSDGFGVEPDVWMKGYLSMDGRFASPFGLSSSALNQKISERLKKGVHPLKR